MTELLSHLQANAREQPDSSLYFALVLADDSLLEPHWKAVFRSLGLLHLLVVSGLHTSIFLGLFLAVLRLPLQALYVCRGLSPVAWNRWDLSLQSAVVVLVFWGLQNYPFEAPATRAALCFVGHWILAKKLLYLQLSWRLFLVVVLQASLFPQLFLSLSNGISWLAYSIVLVNLLLADHRGFMAGLLAVAKMQLVFSAMTVCLFGELALVGVAANILIVPVFPLVLVSMVIAVGTGLPDFLGPAFFYGLGELAHGTVQRSLYLSEIDMFFRVVGGFVVISNLLKLRPEASIETAGKKPILETDL